MEQVVEKRPYVCPIEKCPARFYTPSKVERHLVSHEGERRFECSNCGKNFSHKCHLKRHVLEDHGDNPLHPCPIDDCTVKVKNKRALIKHFNSVHRDKPKPFTCEFCDESFHKRLLLRMHHVSAHKIDKYYKCPAPNCDKSFTNPTKLRRHAKIHNGYPCKDCQIVCSTWQELQKHNAENHRAKISCSKCGKEFSTIRALKNHKPMHADSEKLYHCKYEGCKKSYARLFSLKEHIRVFHVKEVLRCSLCGKEFLWKRSLERHAKVHTPDSSICNDSQLNASLSEPCGESNESGGTKFSCPTCNIDVRTASTLKKHMEVHRNKRKAFACTYEGCSKYYYSAPNLNAHVRVFHCQEKLKCDHCSREFMWKKSLVKHMHSHEPGYVAPIKKPCGGSKLKPLECFISGIPRNVSNEMRKELNKVTTSAEQHDHENDGSKSAAIDFTQQGLQFLSIEAPSTQPSPVVIWQNFPLTKNELLDTEEWQSCPFNTGPKDSEQV